MTSVVARRRIPKALAWGSFGVLAWAAFTVLVGGGSAQADDTSDGPLDGLTSLVSTTVDEATSVVTPIVSDVVTPVVQTVIAPVTRPAPAVVEKVTETVVSVPVVGPAVEPVVTPVTRAAADTVTVVTESVADLLQADTVSSVTDPVLGVVSDVPVVGDLLDDLGVTGAVDDVAGIVDDTTGLIGDTVDGVVPPIVDAVVPGGPSTQETTPPLPTGTAPADRPLTALRVAPASVGAPASPPDRLPFIAATTLISASPATGAPDSGDTPAHTPPASPSPSSSVGHGAGSPTDGARLSDASSGLLHAWKQASGASDDELPSSPVTATDVSPD